MPFTVPTTLTSAPSAGAEFSSPAPITVSTTLTSAAFAGGEFSSPAASNAADRSVRALIGPVTLTMCSSGDGAGFLGVERSITEIGEGVCGSADVFGGCVRLRVRMATGVNSGWWVGGWRVDGLNKIVSKG